MYKLDAKYFVIFINIRIQVLLGSDPGVVGVGSGCCWGRIRIQVLLGSDPDPSVVGVGCGSESSSSVPDSGFQNLGFGFSKRGVYV